MAAIVDVAAEVVAMKNVVVLDMTVMRGGTEGEVAGPVIAAITRRPAFCSIFRPTFVFLCLLAYFLCMLVVCMFDIIYTRHAHIHRYV